MQANQIKLMSDELEKVKKNNTILMENQKKLWNDLISLIIKFHPFLKIRILEKEFYLCIKVKFKLLFLNTLN